MKTYKAGDLIPLGELMRAYIELLLSGHNVIAEGGWHEAERHERELLMRTSLNHIQETLEDLPGEIVVWWRE